MEVHRAGLVFDGTRFLEGYDVLVDSGEVVEVRRSTGPAHVDHGPGCTLLPGLVDAHLHLTLDAVSDVVGGVPRDRAALDEQVARNARVALAGGVTTLRDLGDSDYAVVALRDRTAGDPTYPRILASGPPVTPPRGHCHFLVGAETTDVVAAVDERASRGVDVVKVMASGGNITPDSADPWEPQLGVDQLRRLVARATEHGLPVAAHAHATASIRDCVRAGVTSVEHCTFMTVDGVDAPDDLVRALVESPVVTDFTYGVLPGATPASAIARRLAAVFAATQRVTDATTRWVLASDGGVGPQKPHDLLPHSIAWAVWGGVAIEQALAAVTSRPAALLGLEGVVGRLVPGADADLYVVRGDPREDPARLAATVGVWRRGEQAVGPVEHPRPERPAFLTR